MSSLRIAEIFDSIQGEGIWMGIPSTFIRVSGCSLRCVWCDTPYASWQPEGPVMSVSEILKDVEGRTPKHVVVTGGEPMIFPPVEELCGGLREMGRTITIETAGIQYRDLACDLMSLSPKLKHSTPSSERAGNWSSLHEKRRLNLDALEQLITKHPFQLKFVISQTNLSDQVQEIKDLLAQLPHVPPEQILVMAEGTEEEKIRQGEIGLVQTCLEQGWRMTTRLHISLFGNRRAT